MLLLDRWRCPMA